MSRGPGRLERAISLSILDHDAAIAAGEITYPWIMSSWALVNTCYEPDDGRLHLNWKPTRAQRGMAVRAMHRFVERNPRCALMGGEGRRDLWIYDTHAPHSRAWLELRFRKGRFIPWSEARPLIEMGLNAGASTP